jgi:YaiO family outer membrane protein
LIIQQSFASLRSVNSNNEHLEQLTQEMAKLTEPLLPNADSLYLAARDKAFEEGKMQEARKMARNLLNLYPNYDDAKLLIGKTYVAESKYDSARLIYRPLLEKQPDSYDLLWQIAGFEEADKKYADAATYMSKAVQAYPQNEVLLYQQAWLLYEADDDENALKTLNVLLDLNPKHVRGQELKKVIKSKQYQDYVFIEHYFENYPSDSRLVTSAGLFKGFKRSSYIAKLNIGETFPLIPPAYQFEVETYQKLFPTNYLYAEYAFSASNSYFLRHKAALEFYQVIGKPFEVSLGGRMFYWNSNLVKWIFTGSVSYTQLNNYFCLRAFVGLPSQESFVFTYRRLFGDKREQYFYAVAAVGSYSDELVQFNSLRGNAYTGVVGIQKYLNNRWFLHANAGYTYDEYGGRLLATLGFRYYFNMFSKK